MRLFLKKVLDIKVGLLFSVAFVFFYISNFSSVITFVEFVIIDLVVFVFGVEIIAIFKCIDVIIMYKKRTGHVGKSIVLIMYLFFPSFIGTFLVVIGGYIIDNQAVSSLFFYIYVLLTLLNFCVGLLIIRKSDLMSIITTILSEEMENSKKNLKA